MGREIIADVVDVLKWKLAGVIRDSRDLDTRLAQKLSYTGDGLINIANGSPSTTGHSQLKMTKTHDGVDKYNLGVDNSPVKTIISQEGGTHRSAIVMSDANSSNKTSVGIATSEDQGRNWKPRVVVLNNGNVGIGRKSPTQKLDVCGNIVATGTVNGRNLVADGSKLDAMDPVKFDSLQYGATRNDSDANLRSRSNHTGTQPASTISDFNQAVSSSDHSMNIDNPHNVTKAQLGLEYVQNLKFNLIATNPPTALSDRSLGYSIGSCWVDTTTKNWYVCVDSSLEAAVWQNLSEPDFNITAENLGHSGDAVGVFKETVNKSLKLKSLRPGSAALSVTSAPDQIVIDVDAAKLEVNRLIGSPAGSVIGDTDVQTLTNKTISGATNNLTDIGNPSLTGGISATKLSRGEVTDLEFDRLAGVTSSIQNQLNNKAALIHTHASDEILDLTDAIDSRVNRQKGIAGGLATLDLNGKIPAHQLKIDGGVVYRGSWNSSTNTPTLTSGIGTKGDFYMVSVAGQTNLDGINTWQIGDSVMFDGNTWEKFGAAAQVTSVAGKQGEILLTAADITSGVFAAERISVSSVTQHQSSINIQSLLNAPNSAVVGSAEHQTLTNKTISGATNVVTDIGNDSLLGGIDASKIGNGTVSNQRLHYLATITSDVQTQINAKSFIGHSHDAGDIISGQLANARISQSSVVQHQAAIDISRLNGAPLSAVVGTSDEQILRNKTIDGDYNTITHVNNDALTGNIDAAKLSSGQVTNSNFNTLAGATSNLQQQLNAKSALGHRHTTDEIVSGTFADGRISQSSVLQYQSSMSVGAMIGAPQSAICGVTDVQTITNKTISATNNTITDIGNNNIVGGIDASKLADGSVNNLEFQQLNGATSNLQQQLNCKAPVDHGHDASSIVSGVLADARISESSVTQHLDALNLLNAAGENVIASKLKNATGIVTIADSNPPTAGQVLTAINDVTAQWQTPVNENGTITSISMVVPAEFSISRSTITEAGTFTISKLPQGPATIYAGPSIDKSFGNEMIGLTDTYDVGGRIIASRFSLNVETTVISMSFYVTAAAGEISLGIYNNVNNRPGVLQSSTKSFSPIDGWNKFALSNTTILSAGDYWLAIMIQSNSLHFPTSDNGDSCAYSVVYGVMPSNWNLGGNSISSMKLAILVNGTINRDAEPPGFRKLTPNDIPALHDKYVDHNSPQQLRKKNFDTSCQLVDWNDHTKRINFDSSMASSRTTLTIASQQSTNRRVTFPDMVTDDTIMTTGTDQTISGAKSFRNLTALFSGSTVYSVGSASQTSSVIIGVGTGFTTKMVGGCLVFANGAYAFISSVISTTSLIVAQSQTIVNQPYALYYGGFQLDNVGNTSANRLIVNCQNPVSRGLIVRADAAQSANLTEWHNASETSQAVINAAGNFDTSSYDNGYFINGRLVVHMPNATSFLMGHTLNSAGANLGINNTFGGVNSGKFVTTSRNNTLYGFNTGASLTSTELANFSTMMGANAGYQTTGDSNTFYGESAGGSITTGAFNLCVGRDSANESGVLYTGSFNTMVGALTKLLTSSAEKVTVLGYGASSASGGVSIGWTAVAQTNELAIRAGNGVYLLKATATTLTLPSSTSTITLGTNTMTFPTTTDTLVGLNSVQTLNNKTLIDPVITSIKNGNAFLTMPSVSDTLIGRSTTDLLRNKSIVIGSLEYSTGTVSQNASSLIGVNTVFTTAMLGGLVLFADGTQAFITAFISTSILTVTPSQTVASQSYKIYYGGLQIDNRGNVNFRASQRLQSSNGSVLTLNCQQSTSRTLNYPDINADDTIVTTAASQSLTNKNLTATSNVIRATQLATTEGDVIVSASAPGTVGKVLTLTSPTTAEWQTAPPATVVQGGLQLRASYQSATMNPIGTTSTTGVMMGLKTSITPSLDGRVMVMVTGSIKNNTGSRGARVQIRYGTGTAPNNGTALTGTTIGAPVEMLNANNTPTYPLTVSALIMGMETGVTYWIDVSLAAITGGTATLGPVGLIASE